MSDILCKRGSFSPVEKNDGKNCRSCHFEIYIHEIKIKHVHLICMYIHVIVISSDLSLSSFN
jgi:hypothetical protein